MESERRSILNSNFGDDFDERLEDYFEKFQKKLPIISQDPLQDVCNSFFDVDLTGEEMKELQESTSVDLLKCEDEPVQIKTSYTNNLKKDFDLIYHAIPDKLENIAQLETLAFRPNKAVDAFAEVKKSVDYWRYVNMCHYPSPSVKTVDYTQKCIILCIKIYQPYICSSRNIQRVRVCADINLLLTMSLETLRDQIKCNMDHTCIDDVSEEVNYLQTVPAYNLPKQQYPSGFFFVENTFYVDSRSKNMKDTSQVVRDWGSKRGLGPFKSSSMSTTLKDVKFKFGKPYVYQHQGNCEHFIVFSDCRLSNITDTCKPSDYPLLTNYSLSVTKTCIMCAVGTARWIVTDNPRLTHDLNFFCDRCFKSYHFINGVKVNDFKAYVYVDRVAV